jgi:hypothetical protein
MVEQNLPAKIWLDRLGVSRELHSDLAALVADSYLGSLSDLADRLARHGAATAIPLVTTAAFVNRDLRDFVLATILRIGDPCAPALVTILDQPLFEAYRIVWAQSGVPAPGAISEAQIGSLYVYARALEGLYELARQGSSMRPWLGAARAAALPYLSSLESDLSRPASGIVKHADIALSVASGTPFPWRGPKPDDVVGRDIDAGWGRGERERYLHEQGARQEAEARRAEFAAFWFMDQRRRKQHD